MVENKNYTVFSGTGACTKLAFFEQKISSAFCRAENYLKVGGSKSGTRHIKGRIQQFEVRNNSYGIETVINSV